MVFNVKRKVQTYITLCEKVIVIHLNITLVGFITPDLYFSGHTLAWLPPQWPVLNQEMTLIGPAWQKEEDQNILKS